MVNPQQKGASCIEEIVEALLAKASLIHYLNLFTAK